MAELAKATGGIMYRPDRATGGSSASAAELLNHLSLTTRRVRQSYMVALWNLPLTMGLFVALVCVDCLIRKRRGMA
jgi:hypothetical protein